MIFDTFRGVCSVTQIHMSTSTTITLCGASTMNSRNTGNITRISGWIILLIAFFSIATLTSSIKIAKDKESANRQHSDRLDTSRQESGRTWIDKATLDIYMNMRAPEMVTGMYIDRIADLATKATCWSVEFYLWFRWSDSALTTAPHFRVVDGDILSCEKIDSAGGTVERYELYRVKASITKFFNVTRYPRDSHLLTIAIEDEKRTRRQLRFVPDSVGSGVSSRVKIIGYTISGTSFISKLHPYRTNFGDVHNHDSTDLPIYDQAIFAMEIHHPDWGLYFKMFQSLFASVAIALLVFFMKPDGEGRVGLGIGAFFAAVASSCFSNQELPGMGILTMSDMVNIIGMLTILLSVLSTIIVMHLVKDEQNRPLAVIFDRTSLAILTCGYVVCNITIALSA